MNRITFNEHIENVGFKGVIPEITDAVGPIGNELIVPDTNALAEEE